MKRILVAFFFLTPLKLYAQTQITNAGWFTLNNSTPLTKNFSAFVDLQLRTTNRWIFLRQVEFSGCINYKLADKNEIGVGGVLTNTRIDNAEHLRENDRRIFTQYLLKHSLWSAAITHRFRLEQRFIQPTINHVFFAQRLRYRFKAQLPLSSHLVKFNNGIYAVVQDELLVNVQNKEKLTGHIFDQNRFLLAGGYRLSQKLDMEIGYLNIFSARRIGFEDSNVLQLSLSTKF